MNSLGHRLADFLTAKGLRISTKSCLEPHQNVLWLGKMFDLAQGEVRNTDKMLTKCLGIAIKTACSPVSPKVAERVTGKMQWAYGPRKEFTLFLRGWHRFRWGHHRFRHRPSPALISALLDALAISYVPATVDPMRGHFGFAPFLLVDAEETRGGYRLGIFGRNGVMRTRTIPAKNQQQAELSGVLHACRFAVTQKWHWFSLFVDNTAACYSAANMRASTRACTRVKILRALWNLLWHTGMVLNVISVNIARMPADVVSRLPDLTPASITTAKVEAAHKWGALCGELHLVQLFWVCPTVAGGGGGNPRMSDGFSAPSFTVAGPNTMSEWGDQHEEEFHDGGKVGSKRLRGSRGPEGKLAHQARTLRRRAERAEGHLNAEQPRYRLGAMTEQSFELVLCRPVPERDLRTWQTFCGRITRRTRAQYAMARVQPAEKGKGQTQRHLYLVRHELRLAPGVRVTMSFTHHATAVQRVTLNGKADLIKDVFKLAKDDLEQKDSD